jgi:sterol desaturase/sphingolipid hydroxylase (fatty acid hydroxylase superfamily)
MSVKQRGMRSKPLFISLAIFSIYSIGLLVVAFFMIKPLIVMGWFISGLLIFSIVEYLVHRYFFHLIPHNERSEKLQYAIHGNHHHHPDIETNVMIRPSYALALTGIITGLFYLPFRENITGFVPGFITGYSFYLFIHYAYHAYRPPRNFLRVLWKHHYLHHYHDDTKNYGVSSPLWDIVFNTRITIKQK